MDSNKYVLIAESAALLFAAERIIKLANIFHKRKKYA